MIYIALEDLDFDWTKEQVKKFDELWSRGDSLPLIAKTLRREQDEVALLVMDRSRKGAIAPREHGVWGNVDEAIRATGKKRSKKRYKEKAKHESKEAV